MATARLVIVLLLLGVVLLLALQNTAPALPLVFLGGKTVTLPLGVWLVLAIALGALTTLVLTALLGANRGRGGGSKAYKYRPQPFYEPADTSAASQATATDRSSDHQADRADHSAPPPRGDNSAASDRRARGGTWQDWTNLESANQWHDWESVGQGAAAAAQARGSGTTASGTKQGGIGSWFFGNRKTAEQEQVQQSWQELSEDWDGLDDRTYRARGASQVHDNLDDINQGWDPTAYSQPPRDYEIPQTPKRVYQDGSIYSYSYRDSDSTSQQDNIYAPADDLVYGDSEFDRDAYIDLSTTDDYAPTPEAPPSPQDYGAGGYEGEDLGEPEIAEDGVVDADYRVIVPPAPAAEPDPPAGGEQTWTDNRDDDWTDAEDALTP